MSKINISFNDKNYNIEESQLSSASDALKTHLTTIMNGTGASINFGGTTYNIDYTKLSAATNEFVTHLGTISGNGHKISVGGVEYGVDSTKLSSAISELGTVLGGLESGESGDDEQTGYVTFSDGARLTFEELKLAENGVKYGYDASKITDTTIYDDAFHNCKALIEVNLPNCKRIYEYAFYNCYSLTTINLPNCTMIGIDAFVNCTSLTEVNLPNVTNIGSGGFGSCEALTEVSLPNVTSIATYAFHDCTLLTEVNLPNVTTIDMNAFKGCTSLTTLILRSETLCYMNVSAVVDTKIISEQGSPTGEGFIYVPTALYEDYITDFIPKIVEFATSAGVPMDESTATYIATAILRKIEDYPEICNPTPSDPEERLEGDGAEYYTLAPTALSFRSTAPLNELQEIQINGVTVDPSNYTLEEGSTIVTFPIDYLKTLNVGSYEVAVASDSKTVKGDFTVVAPELNEYGFYYNQPYTAYVDMFGGDIAAFIKDDGILNIIQLDTGRTEICNYNIVNNQLIISGSMGTFTVSFSNNGNSGMIHELATTFALGDDLIIADEDYIYIYKEDLGGYEVIAINKYKSFYGKIKTGINGNPTVKIGTFAFSDNYDADSGDNMNHISIPRSVLNIGDFAFFCCKNLTSIYFEGTVSEWNAILKGVRWNEDVPATYVQCSDGQVSLV